MNKIKAKQLLFKVIEALEENNIDYFLKAGTLLGAIRNKNFIDYDTDIDIGTKSDFMDDYSKFNKFLCSLTKRSLYIVLMRGNWALKIKGDNSLHVDLSRYFLNKKKDKYYCINLSHSDMQNYPKILLSDIKTISFLGRKVCIPDKSEQFLEILYGKDWRIPKKLFQKNRNQMRKLRWERKVKFQHTIPIPDEKL